MTLAEHCVSVAFLSVPLRDVGIDFSSIPVLAAERPTYQMHAVIV